MPPRLLALLALLLGLASAGALPDDGVVDDFKRYFKKYKDVPTRVEAILALEGVENESPAVVDALVPVLEDAEPRVVDAAVRVLASFEKRSTIDHLLTELGDESKEARRVGLLRAVADGGYTGATEVLVECLGDRAWPVRRRALEALGSTGKEGGVPVAIAPLCADSEPAVRCAALDALARLRSPLVLDPARARLADESWQVRSSAIAALGAVRDKGSIGPLVERLAVEEGRLTAEIGAALGELTGRNFGRRLELWQSFWESYADRFEIPTDEELAKMRAAQRAAAAAYTPTDEVTYHGIETPSRRILFVIDVSGSMENLVVQKERFEAGDYPSFQRIDIVKTELARTIERLEGYVEFNVLAFATEVERWKKKLVRANVLGKSSALDFVGDLEALGGTSSEVAVGGLGLPGGGGAAAMGKGRTNTHAALMAALEAAGRGVRDKDYEVAVDTIFFLSDGRPSVGEFVDPDDILREVREANTLRKVVIHTIAIGEFQKAFMERLAAENGGVFVDLGH